MARAIDAVEAGDDGNSIAGAERTVATPASEMAADVVDALADVQPDDDLGDMSAILARIRERVENQVAKAADGWYETISGMIVERNAAVLLTGLERSSHER